MRNLKAYISILLLAVAFAATAAGKETAESVLDGLRAKITGSPSVEAVFTINGGQGPVQGSLIMSGSKYTMTTPQMRAWFDGRTQWAMMMSSKEVNISQPDRNDLMATNPFAILTAHKDYYKARLMKGTSGMQRVELIPSDRTSVISQILVTVNQRTGWPTALDVVFDDGRKISVRIDSMTAGAKKRDSVFTYNPKEYPAFEIVDLR